MKTIIVDIAPQNTPREELEHRMAELESLVTTYGWIVIVKRIQKRDTPDYTTYVGSGKLEEIIAIGEELSAELIVIGNMLKPAQIYHIGEMLEKRKSKMKAWDRLDLILKIFAAHAVSPESRLQIELASIHHMGPRIFGMGMELSRQGWGGSWAMRGLGETNTEIMKRHLREQELKITEKLEHYERSRAVHRASRKRKDLKTVGIVGYTNAGKSSLMNALTKKWVLAEDKLFATLGTSVGKMWVAPKEQGAREKEQETGSNCPPEKEGQGGLSTSPNSQDDGGATDHSYHPGHEILINDTIGFIRDLPPSLIQAFSSTLEDSIESDLLLHVVDASDPRIADKIRIVEETLASIGANQPRLYVFNKIDQVPRLYLTHLAEEFKDFDPIFVSAVEWIGLEELKDAIVEGLGL